MVSKILSWLVVMTAAGAVAGTGPEKTVTAAHRRATTHTVVIEGMRFQPQDLTVKVGDTIVWVNQDLFPHTATATGKQFDSHDIASRGSWKWTARNSGVYAYACALHPTMVATLRVQ